jgi:hypothetical protein
MIALLAAALAPSHGQPYRPIGAVGGFVGLFASAWIGWYAIKIPVRDTAKDAAAYELRRRQEARHLLVTKPDLARRLAIGRPELDRQYDDGGLIDVNHVPLAVLAGLPGMDPSLAMRLTSVRDEINGFDSYDDLVNLLDLAPDALAPWSDQFVFLRS